jgi:2'-5' RNA ligase
MSQRLTVGVLITIPEPHATVLSGWRRHVGDPQADLIPPHVTLLPPTHVRPEDVEAIETHLREAGRGVDPFPMHLFGTGTFRPLSPVVFIQVARGLAECEVLEKSIRCGPLDRELDFPYHPHVTVAQEIDDAGLDEAYDALSTFVARFVVEEFSLFVRPPDGVWTRRRSFTLGGCPNGEATG